ncbi:hypothetical protein GN244_ATG06081 [Phytophthora infestans]|uniref:Uncharacterized protein n=1 Tax=Phytophthora infestans TaxID=4787 RepID=A0A833WXQ3_PHYIN|nr:hypothetical protein GN244_ATG06081 [Phytophthora infestans]
MRSVEHTVLNGTTKWKSAMDIAGTIVEAMSSQGTQTFLRMAEVFREFGECKPSNTFNKAAAFELSQTVKDTSQSVNVEGSIADESTEATCRLILRKRRSKERGDSSPGDSSSHEDITEQFRVSTGVKSKGRPKIRRKQAREAKELQMNDSIAEAKALVQGTLVPEKDLALVRKTLACSFNVEGAVPVLHSITKVDAPTWKATSIVQLARKQKVHKKVTIVFLKNYVRKCIAGINIYRKSLPSDHETG